MDTWGSLFEFLYHKYYCSFGVYVGDFVYGNPLLRILKLWSSIADIRMFIWFTMPCLPNAEIKTAYGRMTSTVQLTGG